MPLNTSNISLHQSGSIFLAFYLALFFVYDLSRIINLITFSNPLTKAVSILHANIRPPPLTKSFTYLACTHVMTKLYPISSKYFFVTIGNSNDLLNGAASSMGTD